MKGRKSLFNGLAKLQHINQKEASKIKYAHLWVEWEKEKKTIITLLCSEIAEVVSEPAVDPKKTVTDANDQF